MNNNNKFKTAWLKDNVANRIVAKLERKEEWESALSCNVYFIIGWGLDGLPSDYQFAFNASIKWDGCSHFNMYGEDYNPDDCESEIDSYYHLCGVNYYYEFFLLMLFSKECAKYWMNINNSVDFDEELYVKIPEINIYDNYEIVYEL